MYFASYIKPNAMKKLLVFTILIVTFIGSLFSQSNEYTGMWLGIMTVTEQMSLQIGFEIAISEGGKYSAKMNVVEQKAYDIPMDVCTIDGQSLYIEFTSSGIVYEGIFDFEKEIVAGTFQQGGGNFELELLKTDGLPKKIERAQTPKRPFPYSEEEVVIVNSTALHTLAGTLSKPKEGKKFPAIILLHGSGKIDRNETEMGHFLLLADLLTRNGYAVLRYDKRGVGESEGDYNSATTFDFAEDAVAALEYLKNRKDIDKKKIGLIGHSEGAIIAPIVFSEMKKDVDFMILMGGVGIKGKDILLQQEKTFSLASGVPKETVLKMLEKKSGYFDAAIEGGSDDEITERVKAFDPEIHAAMLNTLLWKWYRTFLSLNPAQYLEQVSCPVLAITGEKDTQCEPEQNLPAIEAALKKGGNENVTIKIMQGQNHLFQEAKSGLPYEYDQLEDIINESTLEVIISWINGLN
jgi:pimeloyl-ACP methyl ester carboxylesterase